MPGLRWDYVANSPLDESDPSGYGCSSSLSSSLSLSLSLSLSSSSSGCSYVTTPGTTNIRTQSGYCVYGSPCSQSYQWPVTYQRRSTSPVTTCTSIYNCYLGQQLQPQPPATQQPTAPAATQPTDPATGQAGGQAPWPVPLSPGPRAEALLNCCAPPDLVRRTVPRPLIVEPVNAQQLGLPPPGGGACTAFRKQCNKLAQEIATVAVVIAAVVVDMVMACIRDPVCLLLTVASIVLPEVLPAVADVAGEWLLGREAVTVGAEGAADAGAATRVPNPWGRFGSPEHQAEIGGIIDDLTSRGFGIDTERAAGGRFVDVAGTNRLTGEQEWYQVGRQTKGGIPVARERRALLDILNSLGDNPEDVKVFFVPYN